MNLLGSKLSMIVMILILLLACWQEPFANDAPVKSYFENGITIGFVDKDLILADPIYLGTERINGRELRDDPRLHITGREHFIPLPDDYIARYVKDRIGDTVMVLNSAGRYLAIIDEVGYWIGGCSSGMECSLRPIEQHVPVPSGQRNLVVFRKGRFYNGPIIPFQRYQIDDPSYLSWENSVKEILTATYKTYDKVISEEQRRGAPKKILAKDGTYHEVGPRDDKPRSYELHPFNIRAFGPLSENKPDSLYIAASGATGGEASWFALYKAHLSEKGWEFRTVMEPWRGPWRYDIYCAFDLNEDGKLEYLILDWGAALVNITDEGYERIVSSQHSGC